MPVYAGVHLLAKATVALVMLSAATPPGKYAAVWAGASTPDAHRWVQAGIVSIDNRAYLYAESRGARYRIEFAEFMYRLPVKVSVVHRGSRWRATAGSVHTPWLLLRHGHRLAALEVVNGGHATARIGGRLVHA